MSQDARAPIILTAGGTGGHIFPAEALAEVLLARGESVMMVTDKRFAQFKTGALAHIPIHTIAAGTLGGGVVKKIRGAGHLLLGLYQAQALIKRLAPKVIVGFGGYPSFPAVFNGPRLGVPTIIHEQNSILGRANRVLVPRVDVLATSLPNTQLPDGVDASRVVVTGNPVRVGIRALKDVPFPDLQADGTLHILVTGGSLGASVFSDVVPEAIAALPAHLRSRIRLDQQCRAGEVADTRTRYAQLGVSADVMPFFVDMPARLARAHLVIARSGASTVAELAVAGRPAVLVPLPSAMDNHQYYNAQALEEAGGGWVMTQEGFTASALSARLEAFLTAPDTLQKAANQARTVGMPDAAEHLADIVQGLARDGAASVVLQYHRSFPHLQRECAA